MTRLSITLRNEDDRRRAVAAVVGAKLGMRVDIKEERRSIDQNSKLWAALSDISEQVPWPSFDGKHVTLTPDEYKQLFMAALKGELRVVPNIDGNGLVTLGRSSSDLSKEEFSALLELVLMFGANHQVKFSEPVSAQPAASHTEPETPTADPTVAGTPLHWSALCDAWRDSYIDTMTTSTTKAMSIATRHETALQMVGGKPNEFELDWMRKVARVVTKRDKGAIQPDVYQDEIERLRAAPLEMPAEAAA